MKVPLSRITSRSLHYPDGYNSRSGVKIRVLATLEEYPEVTLTQLHQRAQGGSAGTNLRQILQELIDEGKIEAWKEKIPEKKGRYVTKIRLVPPPLTE